MKKLLFKTTGILIIVISVECFFYTSSFLFWDSLVECGAETCHGTKDILKIM